MTLPSWVMGPSPRCAEPRERIGRAPTSGRFATAILKRSVTRAQARDKVKRNVVMLCEIPKGRPGRPSKALTLEQAEEVLAADDGTQMHAYVVVSLLTGARTEEMRGLRWDHVVAYDDQRQAWLPVTVAGWGHISTSSRSLRHSRRNWANSSRSALVRPPSTTVPASRPACLTHSRTAVSVRSKSRRPAPQTGPRAGTTPRSRP